MRTDPRLTAVALLVCASCDEPAAPTVSSTDVPPWATAEAPVAPRPGMVWIPKGVLIVGTPLGQIPRVADAEMAGEQLVMGGFYVDIYPHPNEPGAIAMTNVTQSEAAGICAEQSKRLCTELELERACKGPDNTAYPYGPMYRRDACGTGKKAGLVPNGYNAGCVSAFGAHDTHGTVWSWTSSPWGRGTEGLVALRGGNSSYGDVVGRCANGRPEKPDERVRDVGFRCCAGDEDKHQVVLEVQRGDPLKLRHDDEALARRFEALIGRFAALDEGVPAMLGAGDAPNSKAATFVMERTWTWRPLGNEELVLGGGCSPRGVGRVCGVVVARDVAGELVPLLYAPTDKWQPMTSESERARDMFVHGGDDNGAFRRRVSYEWGRVTMSPKERKKKRGKGKYSYD